MSRSTHGFREVCVVLVNLLDFLSNGLSLYDPNYWQDVHVHIGERSDCSLLDQNQFDSMVERSYLIGGHDHSAPFPQSLLLQKQSNHQSLHCLTERCSFSEIPLVEHTGLTQTLRGKYSVSLGYLLSKYTPANKPKLLLVQWVCTVSFVVTCQINGISTFFRPNLTKLDCFK